jgi:hypothetical protein
VVEELPPDELVPGESPTAILPSIHIDCSYTSRFGLDKRDINVGMASAWRSNRCCEDGDNCWGKEDKAPPVAPGTGVGGGRKELLGTALWAPPGGGASDVKFIPPVGGVKAEFWKGAGKGAAEGKSGAGGNEKEDFVPFSLSNTLLFCMVDVKLASNAATASGDSVCEKESGGKGTLPGAGATNDGYG